MGCSGQLPLVSLYFGIFFFQSLTKYSLFKLETNPWPSLGKTSGGGQAPQCPPPSRMKTDVDRSALEPSHPCFSRRRQQRSGREPEISLYFPQQPLPALTNTSLRQRPSLNAYVPGAARCSSRGSGRCDALTTHPCQLFNYSPATSRSCSICSNCRSAP